METLISTPVLSLPRHHPNYSNQNPANLIRVNNDRRFVNHPTLKIIEKCSNLTQLKQIHAQMLRTGLFYDTYAASKLFSASALSSFASLDYARKVFDQIPQPNVYTWNTFIRVCALSGEPNESVMIFLKMLYEGSESPNKFTFPCVIKAAAEVKDLLVGQGIHGMVVKASLGSNLFVSNSLINLYASCGYLEMAYQVFVRIRDKDVVSWNSMIKGFVKKGCHEQALEHFKAMEVENVKPNVVTMVSVLSACAKKMDLEFGRWVCDYVKRNGIIVDLTLNNAMLDMYVKCGSFDEAEQLFDKMEKKDIISWTTLLDGYAKLGNCDKARKFFDAIPMQGIAAWNTLISGYEQSGNPKEAVAIFRELQLQVDVKPDQVTLVSTLSACAQLGALDLGTWIHVYIKKHGIKINCHLATSLIDMYSKCGDLKRALDVFHSVERRDVFVWSSMIGGFAMHGRGKDAVNLFYKMQEANVKPTAVTFTNVLCACSHTGLVDEGKKFFKQMECVYQIKPVAQHYTCMVDILGRAGLLDEAKELITKMPFAPIASVWGALLGACKLHGNVELAEQACSNLLNLDPRNHGAYVLLSNIYAKTGRWDCVSELRKRMRDSGLKKEPGCSSIEVNGNVHEFLVGDDSHPLSKDIYSKLDEIVAKLKLAGYVPNKEHLLQLVEEEDMKEQALNLHSEKLAIAFAIITTGPSETIRIVKNLRICGDCHSFAKLVSKVYDREILLRDRYRFHQFSGGNCSCKEYW
ncbi:hypothetical protein ACFE04_013076 [Oxalis oulophora]